MDILELSKKVDEIESKFDLGNITALLRDEFAITPTKELEKVLKELEENERELKIGVIGRVKAGKSTLLNGIIFDGETILPKAATPMTASLTILKYSEEDEVVVEFFDDNDLIDLKREHDKYEREFETIFENEKRKIKERAEKRGKNIDEVEIKKRAQRVAKKELESNKKLSSSFELYEKIKNSTEKPTEKNLKVDKNRLEEFVGANGKFMPFTKSVTMKLNDERLKDIQIIDTPGVNDPIISREEKTKELLKYCDVVFVVSPSGQFLSNEDIDLLDRVSQKEGVNEIVIVASRIDGQLFGNEKDENGGILPQVLNSIVDKLTKHAKGVFKNDEYLKFVKNLQNIDKVIYTSGLSYSIYKKLEQGKNLDEGENHLFNLLKNYYSTYFEDDEIAKQNLLMISNIDSLRKKIEEKKGKKEKIFLQKKEEFAKKKLEVFNQFINSLIKEIENRKKRLENGDIQELKEEAEKLKKIKEECSLNLQNSYNSMLDLLSTELIPTISEVITPHFKEISKDIRDSEDSVTESYVNEYEVKKERDGFLGKAIDWLVGKKTEIKTKTITNTYTTVKAGFIQNSLSELVDMVENDVNIAMSNYLMEWKKRVKKEIVSTFRETAGDENVDMILMSRIINHIITKIEFPQIDYSGIPSSLKRSGTLKGSEAEYFINEAIEFKNSFQKQVKNDLKNYLNTLLKSLNKIDVSKMIFENYDKEIEKLTKEFENKKLSLERYQLILNELKGLK